LDDPGSFGQRHQEGDCLTAEFVPGRGEWPGAIDLRRSASKLSGVRMICVLLLAALALTTALAACGGGGSDDRAKVEASLQDYLSTLDPRQEGVFPLGAGAPQVRENSCKNLHTGPARLPEGFAGWRCVITFPPRKTAMPVAVGVNGSGVVTWAAPVSQAAPLPPATVYEGGP
jgi:hypothetical protein